MCVPVYGHKGGLGLEVEVEGRAAHSSKPHLGINALSAGARIIAAIDAEQERLASQREVGVLGAGTVSVNEMGGGRARNIIPDHCELYIGRRIADGEDYQAEFARLTELVRAAALPARVKVQLANDEAFLAMTPGPGYPDGTSLDEGYCAQGKYLALLEKELGARAGYKAGLTNTALQERFGTAEPVGACCSSRCCCRPEASSPRIPASGWPTRPI